MRKFLIAAVAMAGLTSQMAFAQADASGMLVLELNRLEPNENTCRVTFIAMNGFPVSLSSLGIEMVVFDSEGLVKLMTVFDFGELTGGKTLVKRFDLATTQCSEVTRILVNGVARCSGEGIEVTACSAALATANKTGTQFGM